MKKLLIIICFGCFTSCIHSYVEDSKPYFVVKSCVETGSTPDWPYKYKYSLGEFPSVDYYSNKRLRLGDTLWIKK
jgi:hypothetical protein